MASSACAAQLQPRAVHHRLQGHGAAARLQPGQLQCLGRAAYGRVVRHREVEAKKGDDGADQALGLAQRQAEHRTQRQRRRDRQSRVAGLPTPRGARLGFPGRDRLLGEPHRQAAALTQRHVVGGRVLRPVLLLGMWWRWSALALNGKMASLSSGEASTAQAYLDQQVRTIRAPQCLMAGHGRMARQRMTGYGKRNATETAIGRYKRLIGPKLRACGADAQAGEVALAVQVLNRMIHEAKPVTLRRTRSTRDGVGPDAIRSVQQRRWLSEPTNRHHPT